MRVIFRNQGINLTAGFDMTLGVTAAARHSTLATNPPPAVDRGIPADIERSISLDIAAARAEFAPSPNDDEGDLRLVIYDYIMDEIAYVEAMDFVHVGLWLGYGKQVGQMVHVIKGRHKFGLLVKPAYHEAHAAVLHCLACEILRGNLDTFRKRLANPSSQRLALTVEEKKRLDEKSDEDLKALFSEVSSAVDEMVVAYREGAQASPALPPLPERKEVAEAWPHIPIVGIAPHHFLMLWGVAAAKRLGLQTALRHGSFTPEELSKLGGRLAEASKDAAETEFARYTSSWPKQVEPLSASSAEYLKECISKAVMIGSHWYMAGFPTLRPTHRLAASLMATHVPADLVREVVAPFPSFFVEIPNDLVPSFMNENPPTQFRYTHVGAIIGSSEICTVFLGQTKVGSPFLQLHFFSSFEEALSHEDDVRVKLILRLLVNMMIEADQPNIREEILKGKKVILERRKEKTEQKGNKNKVKKAKKPSKPEEEAWFISFRRDIKVDARAWVGEYIRSKGQAPSVQTLVRGHQKRQPHGPGRTLRKWIHVEPYWRGPEDAPTVVRAHRFDKREREREPE